MNSEMKRRAYIEYLDMIRAELVKVAQTYSSGQPAAPHTLETERREKTSTMFTKLVVRLFEDAAVSEKILAENRARGVAEQDTLDFDGEDGEPEGGAK